MLQCPDLDDAQEYQDLKEKLQDQDREELILKRVGGAKAAATFATPNVIKNLRPRTDGCTLNFQLSANAFQAYYRRPLTPAQLANPRVKKNWSMQASFGTKRSQHAALRQAVAFLWKKHRDVGQDRDVVCMGLSGYADCAPGKI